MQDIVNERIVSFINSFDRPDSEICMTIEKEARDTYVPIIRKEMASFLKVLLLWVNSSFSASKSA